MTEKQPNNPLHGITLEMVVSTLVDHFGWDGLSVKSSLKFLRRTPWARDKVEALYISTLEPSYPWVRRDADGEKIIP